MTDELCVQIAQSQVIIIHGQVGNIRHRLEQIRVALKENRYRDAMDAYKEAYIELGFMEGYLPPHNLKLRLEE